MAAECSGHAGKEATSGAPVNSWTPAEAAKPIQWVGRREVLNGQGVAEWARGGCKRMMMGWGGG